MTESKETKCCCGDVAIEIKSGAGCAKVVVVKCRTEDAPDASKSDTACCKEEPGDCCK